MYCLHTTGFGNDFEFDDSLALPRPRSCCHNNVYHPVIRVDYTPPIAGMFVAPYLRAFVKEMTTRHPMTITRILFLWS